MKKVFLTLMTLVLVSSSLFMNMKVTNASTIIDELCGNCEERLEFAMESLEKQGTEVNLTVGKKDKIALDKLVKEINKKTLKKELKEIEKNGFKHEKKADSYLIFNNLKDKEIVYEKLAVVTQFYINKNGNFVKSEFWINYVDETLIKYTVDEFSLDENGEMQLNSLANYDIKNNISDSSTFGFTFGGISFACSASGIIACVAAFGGLAAVLPVWGVPLALACELAFSAGCAIS